MVELLAPAGSREALAAAVENGADAVYLAGNRFGARAYAENFDEEALREAIRYAHLRGVAVHVTVNTAVDDTELSGLADYLRFLEDAGADAVLVQDLGVARLAREVAPGLPLHASTQMTVHNLAGVRALEDLGFSRVVLSREMSLAEIREICAESNVEIEVFAHGALCVCYSGQCLMSSMIGGRSGNRGRCAQPCRLTYELVDENGQEVTNGAAGKYLLSPRDLKTIDLLPELIGAGVASLKLEGRMKRPEYVAVATAAYRGAIDRALSDKTDKAAVREANRRLAQIFNRDFTTAYLLKNPGKEMMSDRRPNNRGLLVGRVVSYDAEEKRVRVKLTESLAVGDQADVWVKTGGRVTETVGELRDAKGREIERGFAGDEVTFPLSRTAHPHDRIFCVYDSALTEEARASYTGAGKRRIPVRLTVMAKVGEPFSVTASADGVRAEAKSEYICPQAEKRPLTKETLEKQMERMGTTAYALEVLEADIGDGVMVPMSVMNETRREALSRLDEARLSKIAACRAEIAARFSASEEKAKKDVYRKKKDSLPKLVVHADTSEKARAALEAGADGVLYGGDAYDHHLVTPEEYKEVLEFSRATGKSLSLATPRILRERFLPSLAPLLRTLSDAPADDVYVHHLGALRIVREYTELPVVSDFSLLAYNALAVRELADLGFSRATLSPELNFPQIEALTQKCVLPVECIVHGRLELMVSAYCAPGSFLGDVGSGACSAPCVKGKYFLKDRTGAIFPVVTDAGCQMHILNAKVLSMLPQAGRFARLGAERIRIDGRYMTAREIGEIVRGYREFLYYDEELSEAQKERARRIEGGDVTRGHYFRGVL
ncbi:MAG: DUF3656 domain-containing protein [Schwartzia sp.]|nr:DUF3656 domain-containing protein [Schwartzia sp. (in: firmicutes)]